MKIIASVPTVYELDSLIGLGWGFHKHSDGSFSSETDEFNTYREFERWLRKFKKERYDPYVVTFSKVEERLNKNKWIKLPVCKQVWHAIPN